MVAFCQRLVASPAFGRTVLIVIVLAAVLVGLETSPTLVASHGAALHLLDQLILAFFVVEAVVKITACGRHWTRYFKDPWNVFDFSIVAVCLLPFDSQFAAVLRLARVLRVLRLITGVPRLRVLVGALLGSIPSMGYVGLLLGLQFYVYAVVGVHFFSGIDPDHFGNLGVAMLTLFQTLTLEGWVDFYETQVKGGAPPLVAVTYFASFILLGAMVTLNLLIGVVVNGLEEMHRQIASETADAAEGAAKTDIFEQLALLESDLDQQMIANRARLDLIRRRAGGNSGNGNSGNGQGGNNNSDDNGAGSGGEREKPRDSSSQSAVFTSDNNHGAANGKSTASPTARP